jgi:hypothetical protein
MKKRLAIGLLAASVVLSGAALAQDTAPPPTQSEPAAQTIASGPALSVPLRRDGGSRNALSALPRIAIVGYNLGAFVHTRVTATSGGSLLGNSLGARARMDFTLVGVDRAALERIATAAHADLVAQMQAAGIEVVPATEVFANGQHARFLADGGAYEGTLPGTENEMLVVGPAGVGAVTASGIARSGGGSNAAIPIASSVNAILIYPNLAIDFVQTSGSGRRVLGNRANVEGQPNIGVNPLSVVQVHYSRGRFLDGWTTLNMTESVWADEEFATVEQISESNNDIAAGVSAILGAGMRSGRRSGYQVTADAARYEQLAMRAAIGFNTAIVQQVLAARAGR